MHGNVHNLHLLIRSTYLGAYHNILCVKYLNTHIGAHLWATNNNREMNYLENHKRRYCNTIRNDILFCTHYNRYLLLCFTSALKRRVKIIRAYVLYRKQYNNICNERNENKKRNKPFCRFDKLVKCIYNT